MQEISGSFGKHIGNKYTCFCQAQNMCLGWYQFIRRCTFFISKYWITGFFSSFWWGDSKSVCVVADWTQDKALWAWCIHDLEGLRRRNTYRQFLIWQWCGENLVVILELSTSVSMSDVNCLIVAEFSSRAKLRCAFPLSLHRNFGLGFFSGEHDRYRARKD